MNLRNWAQNLFEDLRTILAHAYGSSTTLTVDEMNERSTTFLVERAKAISGNKPGDYVWRKADYKMLLEGTLREALRILEQGDAT